MRRTTLGVIRAPLRVHCVVTRLLLAHAAILYVAHLSNKTAINRTVHAAHAHISFMAIHSSYGYGLLIVYRKLFCLQQITSWLHCISV